MPMTIGAYQATTSATQMLPEVTPKPDSVRRAVTITNKGPNPIYVGHNNSVTSANGHPIDPGGSETFDREPNGAFYVITVTANQSTPNDTRYVVEYGVGA